MKVATLLGYPYYSQIDMLESVSSPWLEIKSNNFSLFYQCTHNKWVLLTEHKWILTFKSNIISYGQNKLPS